MLNEPVINVHFDGRTPPLVIPLTLSRAKEAAKALLDMLRRAPKDALITLQERGGASPWTVNLTVKSATVVCDRLCDAILRTEEAAAEARRAAGYSPVSAQTHVERDEKGEIVSMTKTLSY